ncbi:MAG: YHYH protein [Myxococcales bacterium]|nr:YHYH protein [Myxococcales bacterium]
MNSRSWKLPCLLFSFALAACGDSGPGGTDGETAETEGETEGGGSESGSDGGEATSAGATTEPGGTDSDSGASQTSGETAETSETSETSGETGEPSACPDDVFLDLTNAPGAGDGYPAPVLEVECTEDTLVVHSNGIPHYRFIQITPNALVEQDHNWEITLFPEVAAEPTEIPMLGLVGFTVNGQPFFSPNEGPQPADQAFGDPIFNSIMDECLGHTAFSYHYHALVERCLIQAGVVDEPWSNPAPPTSEPSPILAFAYDGFPIYGARGCADAGCSQVIEYKSSWAQIGDPTMNAWDAYEYQAQDGPEFLDRCNGHYGPDGDYHYHATAGFPYIIGCYSGTPGEGVGGDGGGGMQLPQCQQGQTMCCGDDICDGPETVDNCPADC